MGKLLITDGELRKAAAAVRDAMLASIPAEEDCPHEFSPGFEERVFRLYEEKRAEKKRPKHRVLRRIAAIFLAAVIGFGVWMAADPVARAAVTRWFREVYETRIVYRFTNSYRPDVPQEVPEVELTWVPEGYERTWMDRCTLSGSEHYELPGSKANYFSLSYILMSENTGTTIDNIDDEGTPVEINGVSGFFYVGTKTSLGNVNILVLPREDMNVLITILSPLPKYDILHIAEGLKLYNPPKK